MKFEDADFLESPGDRTFVISIRPRGGVKGAKPQVVIVKAYSAYMAKLQAFARVSVGRFKNSSPAFWVVDSCEATSE